MLRATAVESLRTVHRWAAAFGVDALRMAGAFAGLGRFVRSVIRYRRLQRNEQRFQLLLRRSYPCLGDWSDSAGVTGHYFWQDLWAARKIYEARPATHVDVGSRIDGFVAHLLAFMPVMVVDIRPMPMAVDGLTFIQDDATTLRSFRDRSIESLSSLHAVEHFGLGRYGDPIDPDAPFRAMRTFEKVLRPGGRLYLGVPIGRERLEFNAHRVFAPQTILESLPGLELLSFGAVDDNGRYVESCSPGDFVSATHACGLFELVKEASRLPPPNPPHQPTASRQSE